MAIVIAVIACALDAAVLLGYPSLRLRLSGWEPWALRLLDLVAVSAPLVVGILVAHSVAGRSHGRTGIRSARMVDVVLGLSVAAVLRALVELVTPTTGTLWGPLGGVPTASDLAGAVVLGVGVVGVTPVVEELFFRGVLQRALAESVASLGRMPAAVIAVVVSTAMFAALHLVAAGDAASAGPVVGALAVGLGCGILTAVTGRLTAAVVAHVAFNAAGFALLIW